VRSVLTRVSAAFAFALFACGADDPPASSTGSSAGHSSASTASAGGGSASGGGGHAGEPSGGHGGDGGSWSSSLSSSSSAGGGPCDPPDADPAIPASISATGLYADTPSKTLASSVVAFTVKHPLWSDGAQKARFVDLPECATIDTSDMDDWSVPVGTKFWKEFSIAGRRVETRFVRRFGPGPDDFVFVAYQWDESETEAYPVPDGVPNANGTAHDVPATWECATCHTHSPQRILGFSAIQLSHQGPGWTMSSLSSAGKLSVPRAAGYVIPGDATTRAALGYLHGNCGHCHNATAAGEVFQSEYDLRVSVAATGVQDTGVYRTAVGVPVEEFFEPGVTSRIAPGAPWSSCIFFRMNQRGNGQQMPPFGTEAVDAAGVAAVESWILSLP
jgi:hypothetical protein